MLRVNRFVLATTIMFTALLFAVKSYSIPSLKKETNKYMDHNISTGRQILLVIMCVIFGIEIGYKISARKLLYILYPCHIMTAVQVTVMCMFFTMPRNYIIAFFIHSNHIQPFFYSLTARYNYNVYEPCTTGTSMHHLSIFYT